MPKNTPQETIFKSGQGKSQIIGLVRILARQAAGDEFNNQLRDHTSKEDHNADHDQDPNA